jgi:ABC-type cobalamin/Fe3+-siderophores transport system ATPase subunit
MPVVRTITPGSQYGPLRADLHYDLQTGYSVLLGKNNAGKSSLLQLIFRDLTAQNDPQGFRSTALILADRGYVDPTAQPGAGSLETWNRDIIRYLASEPLQHGTNLLGPTRSELTRLLMHGDLVAQVQEMGLLLERLGLERFTLTGSQQVQFRDIVVFAQGSGLRAVLPILAALTNPEVETILIDEPETSLEPRLAKVLRDVLIEAGETKTILVATHSHLFVHRDAIEANAVMTNSEGRVEIRALQGKEDLYDAVFDLLGSSTEDLFFPGNYLIVEGASDQVIAQKTLELLGAHSPTVKVLAARGIDAVRDSVESVYRASIPLTTEGREPVELATGGLN